MRERRRSSRFPVQAPVQLTLPDGSCIQGESYNISFDGVRMKSPDSPNDGEFVHLSMQLPVQNRSKRLTARCAIAHVSFVEADSKYRVGLEFVGLDEQGVVALENFFAEQRRGSAAPRP